MIRAQHSNMKPDLRMHICKHIISVLQHQKDVNQKQYICVKHDFVGYTDEPLTKILSNIEDGEIVKLDRWFLNLSPNPKADLSNCEEGRKNLPLNVVNNYFSLGVDARIALEFHEAREARPGKFNSRFRNKMFYGQAGGKDLIQRKWKDLCNYVTLEASPPLLTTLVQPIERRLTQFLRPTAFCFFSIPYQTRISKGFLLSCHHFDYYDSPANQSGSSVVPTQIFQRSQATFTVQ
ncbi:diacylglycerol kinase iota [Trichonephila clavipes]|nr:diacylglycerol kinase iota [Trichonephila clavipes]